MNQRHRTHDAWLARDVDIKPRADVSIITLEAGLTPVHCHFSNRVKDGMLGGGTKVVRKNWERGSEYLIGASEMRRGLEALRGAGGGRRGLEGAGTRGNENARWQQRQTKHCGRGRESQQTAARKSRKTCGRDEVGSEGCG